MFKYRNVSDFRQSVTVAGVKKLLRPGDVFQSEREMRFAFLEPVSTDTPVTVGTTSIPVFNRLEQELEQLKVDKEAASIANSGEIMEAVNRVKANMADLRKDLTEEIHGIHDSLESSFSEINEKIAGLKAMFDNFKTGSDRRDQEHTEAIERTLRRLEMVKSAIMTLEGVVYGEEQGNS